MTISVIIPVYNAAAFIEKAVNSVLQFPEVKEVLLIDDCSTDGSLEISKKISEQYDRVKLVQHPDKKNHGVSATRNLGMDLASQEFIAFLDADDYYLPNRFDAEREYLKNPEIDGVFGAIGVEFITEEGKKKYLSVINDTGLTTVRHHAEGMEVFYGLSQMNLAFGTFFSLIATTLRKSAIDKSKLRLNESMKMHEDRDFIIKLSYHCHLKSGFIDQAVAMRTGHENNTCSSVPNKSKAYYRNQEKLFYSLFTWARKQQEMPGEALELFKLKYLSAKVASKSGLNQYISYALYSLTNPKLLKTRYRYFALKNKL
ncbi:glycosyltransferase family 2 protein [Chryseobacterium sp. L7]|uniref:Glycosyltransferase family 2 protein n=1 Tax=Chryseobacterium endalhagicum TaxID=2797638 RepID=A0ABS1QJD0_9FLAO|nr:glycosyltransferase family 2 protein [Chryseobacterium endalhagicum]MBL1221998.1 glycosyltransferase family 2 protein [Chryseobacterium endalhagicum]